MDFSRFDQRPIVLTVAGPNGAGKTTFYHAHLQHSGLRFVSADVLARELDLAVYTAARAADALRRALLKRSESFIFETVFSDRVGDKLAFLQEAVESGYAVVVCFIGIDSPEISEERVAMRVTQGGHDVPAEKLHARFPRTIANLSAAIRKLPHILLFDNSDLSRPLRQVALFEQGRLVQSAEPPPEWVRLLTESHQIPWSK
jgi:predicted ABC-type ATPase